MLDALRKSASSWVVKILLGLLVISFAVWGVADIFGGYGSQSVAKVGQAEVSAETFRAAYQRELSAMGDRLGRQLTTDEARALGVDRRVLSQLLTTAALTNQARDLDLGVSDEFVAQKIVADPMFSDAFGRFNRQRYEVMLNYSGYSEAAFVAEQQRLEMRKQLTQTVRGDLAPPDVLVAAIHEFQGARRRVDYIVLPAIQPGSIPAPGEEALKTFYSEHEDRFTTPELRSLALIAVEPAGIVERVEVPEDEIAAEYEARRHEFETRERRAIDQVLFTDAENAAAAHEKIAGGADFEEVAAEAGFSESDIDLGTVAQADIVDPKIAEVAFSLGESAISEPVAGALGTAILRVRSIEPASTKPLFEVRDEIRDAIALERAQDDVLDIYDEIEDERAAGLSVSEVANALNLPLVTVEATDRRGRGAGGEPAPRLPASPDLLRAAFETDVGVENNAIETQTGGFIWFDVTAITAPELKPFETIRPEVLTVWREAEAQERLREKADELVERARGGATLESLAESAGAEFSTSEPFTRRSPTTPFAPSLVEAVFAAPDSAVLRGQGRDNANQVVVKIREMLPADPLSDAAAGDLGEQVTAALANDLYEQYVSGLQARVGVTVNETALNALFGDGT